MYTRCVPGVHGGQERELDLLELGLSMVVKLYGLPHDCREWTLGPLEEQQHLC